MSREGAEDDIVASGQALQVVAGWLGITDAQQALEEEAEGQDLSQPRPQGLGLGAKYLPHHKGVLLTSGVQQRLGNKLRQSRERGQPAPDAPPGRELHPHKRQRRKGEPAAAPRQDAGGSGENSDEEEGREAAFAKPRKGRQQEEGQEERPKGQQHQRRQQQRKPVGFSRQDLLSTAQHSAGAAKSKKKNKKKGGGLVGG